MSDLISVLTMQFTPYHTIIEEEVCFIHILYIKTCMKRENEKIHGSSENFNKKKISAFRVEPKISQKYIFQTKTMSFC